MRDRAAGLRESRTSDKFIALVLLMCLLYAPSAVGWGNEGHTYINEVAAEKIPAVMPRFLHRTSAIKEIAYLGPEPDRWRNPSEFALKNAQEPDHFIDLERVEWMMPLPAGRYQFYRKLYEKRAATKEHPDDYLPERVGLQPYITMEVFDRLKAGFREYRRLRQLRQPTGPVERTIIFYAGWLGHYVADGAQPLHTTVNYNGWVGPNPNHYSTQPGIHWRFEGPYVAANIHAKDFAGMVRAPEHLTDPFRQYMDYLETSHTFVEKVYQLDKAGGFNGQGSSEALSFTEKRLAAGAQMLLDLWYTAWLDSATPEPAPGAKPALKVTH